MVNSKKRVSEEVTLERLERALATVSYAIVMDGPITRRSLSDWNGKLRRGTPEKMSCHARGNISDSSKIRPRRASSQAR